MGTDKISNEAFEAWLKCDKNQNILKRIADKIYIKMKMQKLSLPGVDIHLTAPDKEILQELMIFLLENESVKKDLLAGSLGTVSRLQTYLWHRMIDINRGAEGNRDIHKDTRRLLYRHAMDVLGGSDQFIKTKMSSREILFGRTHEPPRAIIMMENLMDIEYPRNLPAHFKTINTKKNILKLAEYFWQEAARTTREPNVRISVRDFIEWIARNVNLSSKFKEYIEIFDDEAPGSQAEYLEKAAHPPEDVMKKNYLTTWANNFYESLKEIEKKIFYYYECKGLRHKDVAALMNKKGNLSYRRDKIRDSLKAFLRPLEWVSPDDGMEPADPADFIFFRDNLCSLLNAAVEGA